MKRRDFLATTALPLTVGPLARRISGQPHKIRLPVFGATMAAVDSGSAPGSDLTFLFLHGNPTSSYLWRRVIPALVDRGRCVAPDLIGMGDSSKLVPSGPYRYRYLEQRDYLDEFLRLLDLGGRVILVVHDWGGMLGFDWARRHPDRVTGIVHMETVMAGLETPSAPPEAVEFFRRFRTPEGERMVLDGNLFVERVLLTGLANLTDADRAEYRRPFQASGEGRRPTLAWPREVPIDGDPADVAAVFATTRSWLASTPVPKLFVNAEPGALLAAPARKAVCRSWPNTTEVTVAGRHFVPEESPEAIGKAIQSWVDRLT